MKYHPILLPQLLDGYKGITMTLTDNLNVIILSRCRYHEIEYGHINGPACIINSGSVYHRGNHRRSAGWTNRSHWKT